MAFAAVLWVGASIVGLFFAGDPSAIVRFVIAVVVDAIERKAGWPFPHISEEVAKIQPSFANRNAAAPVIGVVPMIWVIAPLDHGFPGLVGVGRSCIAGMAMFDLAARGFRMKAAA